MARDPETQRFAAQNRKARHDYHLEDTWEAGIVLVGTEVKALRAGRASLVDGFAEVEGGEVWLQQVHIPQYAQGTWTNHTVRRKRKLLLHRTEIDRIERRLATGYVDERTADLDDALDRVDEWQRAGVARSIALEGNAADVLPELARRGVTPDVVTVR